MVIIRSKSSINCPSALVKVRKQLMVSSHLVITLRYLLYAEVGNRSFVILHKPLTLVLLSRLYASVVNSFNGLYD